MKQLIFDTFVFHTLDEKGHVISKLDKVSFSKFIPPTAKVKTEMDAVFNDNLISASNEAKTSAGAWRGEGHAAMEHTAVLGAAQLRRAPPRYLLCALLHLCHTTP